MDEIRKDLLVTVVKIVIIAGVLFALWVVVQTTLLKSSVAGVVPGG